MTPTESTNVDVARHLLGELQLELVRSTATLGRLNQILAGHADAERTLAELILERYHAGHLEVVASMWETGCWRHLGAPSWRQFCADELDIARSRSYQLIAYGQIRRSLIDGEARHADRVTEAHARPLTPFREQPGAVRSIWAAACRGRHDLRPPTADDVQRAADAWERDR